VCIVGAKQRKEEIDLRWVEDDFAVHGESNSEAYWERDKLYLRLVYTVWYDPVACATVHVSLHEE